MNNRLFTCIFIATLLCVTTFVDSSPHERKLIKNLLDDYQRYERPVTNESVAVDVKHGITINKIELDLDKEILTSHIWINLEWNDVNLQWDKARFGGIRDIRLPSHKIWIPDIFTYNAFDYHSVDPNKQMTNIVVTSNGKCTWIPPMVMRTTCKIDGTTDTQSCPIKVGSWTYNGLKINLTPQSSVADTSTYVRNKKWELISTKAKRNEIFYECCPEPYLDITYTIVLKKLGYTLKNLFF